MNAKTKLLPAILIAGSPHCGKSVLAFLLTQRLRRLDISHYLLRAVPDGEGDWFANGEAALVREIRQRNKRGYTPRFVGMMRQAIEQRLVPLLVDVGGRPSGDQLDLLRACTHYILLYQDPLQYEQWQAILAGMNLLPVAELHSDLDADDHIEQTGPMLAATIGGLERSQEKRRSGAVLEQLVTRVAGICAYDEADLEDIYREWAPWPVIFERDLAARLKIEAAHWSPADLRRLAEIVPGGQALALFGRGPVWLATHLAILSHPAPAALFDPRLGWVKLPQTLRRRASAEVAITCTALDAQMTWAEISLTNSGIITPQDMLLPRTPAAGGMILSGKLPRWYFATLGRILAARCAWVATYDANLGAAVIVASRDAAHPLGSTIPIAPPASPHNL